MTQPRQTIYTKILIGILLPIFLSMALPQMTFANAEKKVQAFAITTNDPFFTTDTSNTDSQWYLPKTHVPEAWDYSKGSANVIVAIIDTGIHATHIELNDGRVAAGFNV